MATFNLSELDALTEKYHIPTVQDLVFEKDAFLKQVKTRKKIVSGGKMFQLPVIAGNLDYGSYGPNQTFTNTKKEILNEANFQVKGTRASLTIDNWDTTINAGNEAIVNILTYKVKALEEAMRQALLQDLYDNPTAFDAANASKHLVGLQTAIDDSGTYGDINRDTAGNEFWRSVVYENGGVERAITYDLLSDFWMDITNGGQEAEGLVFVADFKTVNAIRSILAAKNEINSLEQNSANLGFASFTLFGHKIIAAPKLEALAKVSGKGILYGVNMNYFHLYGLAKNDFKTTKFIEDQDNDKLVKRMTFMGNYVCSNPQRCGKILDIARS